MCLTEYNEERALAQRLEDGIEIGLERGLKQGREEGKIETMKTMAGKLFQKGQTVEEIAEFLEIAAVDVQIWLNESRR